MSYFMLWMRVSPSLPEQNDHVLLHIGALSDTSAWPRNLVAADCRWQTAASLEEGLANLSPTLPTYVAGCFPAEEKYLSGEGRLEGIAVRCFVWGVFANHLLRAHL